MNHGWFGSRCFGRPSSLLRKWLWRLLVQVQLWKGCWGMNWAQGSEKWQGRGGGTSCYGDPRPKKAIALGPCCVCRRVLGTMCWASVPKALPESNHVGLFPFSPHYSTFSACDFGGITSLNSRDYVLVILCMTGGVVSSVEIHQLTPFYIYFNLVVVA